MATLFCQFRLAVAASTSCNSSQKTAQVAAINARPQLAWASCTYATGRRQRHRQWQHLQHAQLPSWRQAGQQRRHLQQKAQHLCRSLQVEAPSAAMPAEEAWQLLEEFTRKEARGLAQPLLDSPAKRQRLRDALLVAAGSPHAPAGWNPDGAEVPEVLLGVIASDVRLAVRALRDYCVALGLTFQMPESRVPGVAAAPAITGPVFVKFNSATRLCYCTRYEGRDRGVLVTLGQQQMGHLPLGLHDEAMINPPVIG